MKIQLLILIKNSIFLLFGIYASYHAQLSILKYLPLIGRIWFSLTVCIGYRHVIILNDPLLHIQTAIRNIQISNPSLIFLVCQFIILQVIICLGIFHELNQKLRCRFLIWDIFINQPILIIILSNVGRRKIHFYCPLIILRMILYMM